MTFARLGLGPVIDQNLSLWISYSVFRLGHLQTTHFELFWALLRGQLYFRFSYMCFPEFIGRLDSPRKVGTHNGRGYIIGD